MPSLELRPWEATDAGAIVALLGDFPDLARQLPTLPDESSAAAWIHVLNEGPNAMFALTADGEPIGNVGASHIDPRHQTAWFSYWNGPMRGTGLMSRAAATVANWLLDSPSVNVFRLELGARINNPASIRVAERAGFAHEGIERAKLLYDGQRFDVATMARLATDPRPSVDPIPLVTPARHRVTS